MPVTPRVKTCVDCHEDFLAKQPHRQDRCPACQEKREAASALEQQERRRTVAMNEFSLSRQLASAIILQAMKDAVHGDMDERNPIVKAKVMGEARNWLAGAGCQFYCDCLGIQHAPIIAWVKSGCKRDIVAAAKKRGPGRKQAEAAHV